MWAVAVSTSNNSVTSTSFNPEWFRPIRRSEIQMRCVPIAVTPPLAKRKTLEDRSITRSGQPEATTQQGFPRRSRLHVVEEPRLRIFERNECSQRLRHQHQLWSE